MGEKKNESQEEQQQDVPEDSISDLDVPKDEAEDVKGGLPITVRARQ